MGVDFAQIGHDVDELLAVDGQTAGIERVGVGTGRFATASRAAADGHAGRDANPGRREVSSGKHSYHADRP